MNGKRFKKRIPLILIGATITIFTYVTLSSPPSTLHTEVATLPAPSPGFANIENVKTIYKTWSRSYRATNPKGPAELELALAEQRICRGALFVDDVLRTHASPHSLCGLWVDANAGGRKGKAREGRKWLSGEID